MNGSTPVTTTTYSDTTASSATTYYYTVTAVYASGSSAASNEANALTYPAAPTGLGAAPASATQINLTWTAPGGTVTGYNVYRGTTPGGESSIPLNGSTLVTTTTYSDATIMRRHDVLLHRQGGKRHGQQRGLGRGQRRGLAVHYRPGR